MRRQIRRYIYTAKREDTGEIICRGSSEDLAKFFGVTSQTILYRCREGASKWGVVISRHGENRIEDVVTHKKQTLCWMCENTNRFMCPWFDIPAKPVDGWKAEKMDVYFQNSSGTRVKQERYRVIECPNFKMDERVKQYEEAQMEEMHRRRLERDKLRYQKAKEKRKNENQT